MIKGGNMMKKTMKIPIIVIIVTIIIGISILAANEPQEGHIPLCVRYLEQTIEYFDGAEFDINTDQSNYSIGEEIIITGKITNYNSTTQTIFCHGNDSGTLFHVNVYDEGYLLVSKELIFINDNSTNPIYTGLFGTFNFSLQPSATITCKYSWNQSYNNKNIFTPRYEYGEQVPPGIYHPVVELPINWQYYCGPQFRARNFGKETTITIKN